MSTFTGHDLRSIVFAVKKLEEAQEAELKRHHAELERIELELQSTRARCPHPMSDFYPDASGGRDSMTLCKVCGAHV